MKSDVFATPVRTSGTRKWAHLEAENPDELAFFARLFKKQIRTDNRGHHIDVSEHERRVALEKGAREGRVNPSTLNE